MLFFSNTHHDKTFAVISLLLIFLLTATRPLSAFVVQHQPSASSCSSSFSTRLVFSPEQPKSLTQTYFSNDNDEFVSSLNGNAISSEKESFSTSFLDSIVKTGMKDLDDLQVGDIVVAKVDIPSLRIWSGSGYEITAMYLKGANPETGMTEEISLTRMGGESFTDVPLGYKKYLEVYNPRDHSSHNNGGRGGSGGGPVIVSPEEMALVTLKSELNDALLLAVPGLFWVFVAMSFVNWYSSQYGGTFWDAMFPAPMEVMTPPTTTNGLINLMFL
mmetsp:Transcript_15825/g.39317  ORF Transcript_15825/g.39317 Transcript_15825/m.39317 type:complete len:273 (-) Transcript_15825:714-1532(-)